jgi:hypothetical protein
MAAKDEERVQLATRIPKRLHRELKLHCVHSERSVMDFVTEAITEKLARDAARRK